MVLPGVEQYVEDFIKLVVDWSKLLTEAYKYVFTVNMQQYYRDSILI